MDVSLERSFPVAERFVSVNGEGVHAGKLAAFIRFSGCDLECSWCDTRWACDPECTVVFYTIDELVGWVIEQRCACVTLTGGEPLLQPHLPELIASLSELPQTEVIEVETNGSLDLLPIAHQRPRELCITMDFKLPSSGMRERMREENLALLEPADVLKFVVGTTEDLDEMKKVLDRFRMQQYEQGEGARFRAFVSPVFGVMGPADIVDFMIEHALTDMTLQLQLHKIIWPGIERGV